MNKLDERQIIKIFQNKFGNKKFSSEDVEVYKLGKIFLVTKIDTLVESTDIPSQMKLADAARKSIVACISDFASKGVKPLFGIISVTIPKRFTKAKIEELAASFGKAAKEFGFKILGGDTNEGRELVIQVALFGITEKIVQRKGASEGDLIFVSGPFGYTAAGFRMLLKRKKSSKKFAAKAKNSFFRPKPRLKFGLSSKRYLSSAMDSSDGLGTTLYQMSKQSRKRFIITNLPIKNDLREFARKNNLRLHDLVFRGGEEYEIVFTTSPQNASKIHKMRKIQKIPLEQIGYVTKGNGVIYQNGNDSIIIKDDGWRHFRS